LAKLCGRGGDCVKKHGLMAQYPARELLAGVETITDISMRHVQ